MSRPRILVAGVGNIFHGDDGFGVEVAKQLQHADLPEGTHVVDFGIRTFDLACAMQDGYDAIILIDAMSQGGEPGTIYVVEPAPDQLSGAPSQSPTNPHGLNPTGVISWVRAVGGKLPPIVIVGCEPASLGSDEDVLMQLSEPVEAAVEEAVATTCLLVSKIRGEFQAQQPCTS